MIGWIMRKRSYCVNSPKVGMITISNNGWGMGGDGKFLLGLIGLGITKLFPEKLLPQCLIDGLSA